MDLIIFYNRFYVYGEEYKISKGKKKKEFYFLFTFAVCGKKGKKNILTLDLSWNALQKKRA